jgi:phenylacetate-CoA ligase
MNAMKKNAIPLDFSEAPLKNRAFSDKPMSFVDEAPKTFLSAIIDLVAIETGNRAAREHWQHKQLQNLLEHASQRSAFWRNRVEAKKLKGISLTGLPILSRSDVVKQVETEGSLLPSKAVSKHATSGSSGTPVQFFISEMNQRYNPLRSVAQYFMEGRDLTLNNTTFKASSRTKTESGFIVERTTGWLGPLNSLLKGGTGNRISHSRPNRDLLLRELTKDPIGYLVIQPSLVESLFYDGDISFLYENGTKMFLPTGEEADRGLREKFLAAGIPTRANYSSEEVGYIAAECKDCPENFHVVQSNVIVEVDNRDSIVVGGNRLGRVLVTHLHSYATPFVRYDVGDFAALSEGCRCGHDGPALSNIYGRKKRLIKHSNGSVSRFTMSAPAILEIIKCDEYRIRQSALDTIEVEIGGIDQLSADQLTALKSLFKKRAGDEFQINVHAVRNINWGNNTKRLAFHSEVL